MTPQDVLARLLSRLDNADQDSQVVMAGEVRRWPDGLLATLCLERLLVPTGPSETAICVECAEGHVEEVVSIDSPPGSPPRFYIPCPIVGRARVDPDDLRQWRLAPEGWAALSARLIGLPGFREAVRGRVWWLGLAELGGVRREVLFVR